MFNEIVYIVGGLLAGGVIGWLLAKQKTNQELSQAKSELSRANALNEANESGDEKTRELLNEERKRVNELLESRFENIATEVNQRNTEAFLQLAEQKFSAGNINYILVPGIQVQIFILTGERTVLSYITTPFHNGMGQALQER